MIFVIFLIFLLTNFCNGEIIIDNMEPFTNWQVATHSNASAVLSPYNDGVQALQLQSYFSNGEWVKLYKDFKAEDMTAGDQIKFWYKATGSAGNNLCFSISGSEKSVAEIIPDNQWHEAVVYLTASEFNGVDFSAVDIIKIVIKGNGSGSVYLDRLALYSSGPVLEKTIDEFEDASMHSDWVKFGHEHNKIDLSIAEGLFDNALKIDYGFVDGDYILIERYFSINFLEGDYLQFDIKTHGDKADLELQMADWPDWNDISVIYNRMYHSIIGKTPDWTTITLELDELAYLYSNKPDIRRSLNLKRIERLSFFLHKGEDSHNCSFMIDNIKIMRDTGFKEERPGAKLIKILIINNNPFSPDNDGWKDSALFYYELKIPCEIKLVIYNLRVRIIK